MVTFVMGKHSKSFATRERARDMAEQAIMVAEAKGSEKLLVNFEDVRVISASFSDEFITRLYRYSKHGHHVQIVNAEPLVMSKFQWALSRLRSVEDGVKHSIGEPELVA